MLTSRPRTSARPGGRPSAGAARYLAAAVGVGALVIAPSALSVSTYPTWALTGATGDQTRAGTMTFGVTGFAPSATVSTSKVVDDNQAVGIFDANSIAADTPWGAVFGASTGQRYLSVRVDCQNANPCSNVATTTYIFEDTVGPGGWGFAFGEIDVDQVTIRAYDASGGELSGAEIQGSVAAVPFLPTPPTSSGLPTWDPVQRVLVGTGTSSDDGGGWFRPSRAVKRLEVVYTGLPNQSTPPLYRTWFAVLSHGITGTVVRDGTEAPVAGATVTLRDPAGTVVASSTSDAAGAFDFGIRYAQAGYTVAVEPPAGLAVVGSRSQTVSNLAGDATARLRLASASSTSNAPAAPPPAPTISIPGARSIAGRTVAVRNAVSGPGAVTVTARRGRTVACTVTRAATAAGVLLTPCRLNAATVRVLATRGVTLRITSTLTDAQGRAATASRTLQVPRTTSRVPVTG
jgi:hypothetical protein